MPPSTLLSPSELAYLHTSLSLNPPIRPDGRSPTSFRPLVAETDLLPTTNGSARLCFADGTEAIVGVKAEMERTVGLGSTGHHPQALGRDKDKDTRMHSAEEDAEEERRQQARGKGSDSWIEVTVDMPGFGRDDDGVVVFLAQMLQEGYPLPLLSLTTHLALLATRLPAPISRIDEDPLFNDDWDAAQHLYDISGPTHSSRPSFTLLVISVGDNIFFDPSREELAVADAVCAVTVGTTQRPSFTGTSKNEPSGLRLLSLRTIDPPARLAAAASATEGEDDHGLWRPARGGMKRAVIAKMVKTVLMPGGVGEEVMEGLERFSGG
ncbi:MAG: hypothetical protein Q9225_008051 [Loekoesia sp. 1 TL-2023]